MRVEGVSANFISGQDTELAVKKARLGEGYTESVSPEVILELSGI